jgi:hypothetical protein
LEFNRYRAVGDDGDTTVGDLLAGTICRHVLEAQRMRACWNLTNDCASVRCNVYNWHAGVIPIAIDAKEVTIGIEAGACCHCPHVYVAVGFSG